MIVMRYRVSDSALPPGRRTQAAKWHHAAEAADGARVKPAQVVQEQVSPHSLGRGVRASGEIVVPVRNEERDLTRSVRRLAAYPRAGFPFRTRVTIADNGSSDGTWVVAEELAAELPGVQAVRLKQSGRGRALRSCWLGSDAEVLAYAERTPTGGSLSASAGARTPPASKSRG